MLTERVEVFHRLHETGCFVIPNPWDLGSARVLEQLGFAALATTSSGLAWSLARADIDGSLQDALSHLREIAGGVEVPVSADFQDGFATDPSDVAANVAAASATGIAGLSIEDSTRSGAPPLIDFSLSVERVHAAREAANRDGAHLLLTARSEGFIVGRPDLDETIRRLTAYSDAGADCLYAPGLRTPDQISSAVQAVSPKPVNVLVGSSFTTVEALADLGVRRISVGGALARAAWTAFLAAAEEIVESGSFIHLDNAVPFGALDGRFRRPSGDGAAGRPRAGDLSPRPKP